MPSDGERRWWYLALAALLLCYPAAVIVGTDATAGKVLLLAGSLGMLAYAGVSLAHLRRERRRRR